MVSVNSVGTVSLKLSLPVEPVKISSGFKSRLGLRHLGKGLLGGACDYFVKKDVSSDTFENEVFEKEVVKVKTDTDKRMY